MVDETMGLEIVDVRNPIDISQYKGEVISSWKRIVKNSQRNYSSPGNVNLHDGRIYILSYPDKSIDVVCPGKGDYIKPGYTRVSMGFQSTLDRYTVLDIIRRCNIKPLGMMLFNPTFKLKYFTCRPARREGSTTQDVYVGTSVDNSSVVGWNIVRYGSGRSARLEGSDTQGIRVANNNDGEDMIMVVIYQDIDKSFIEGRTRLSFNIPNAVNVLIDTDILEHDGNGIWTWEGEAIESNKRLSIQIGDHYIQVAGVVTEDD